MKVSIALCTYNGEKFLINQLESFLRQTRLPDEIVVCDDRSTDASIQLIEKFSRTASFPVRIHVNEKNLGTTKNFEKAISLCTGDVIFLSDQDDVWLPEKIHLIKSEFEQNKNLGMVFTNAELVDEDLNSLEHKLWDFTFPSDNQLRANNGKLFEVLLDHNVVTGATIAFRSSYREYFSPIPTDIPYVIHDAWIALVITANAEVRMLSEPLIKYRRHSNQQLGIVIKPKKHAKREDEFAALIAFQKKEQVRLIKMAYVIEKLPQFKSKRYLLKEDFIKTLRNDKNEHTEKIEHYTARKNLPVKKLPRVVPIIREFRTGRYHRFSNGYFSVGKDLFKHWDPSPEGKLIKNMKSMMKRIFSGLNSTGASQSNKLDFRESYPALVKALKSNFDLEQAMKKAVGGDFEADGALELETLKYFGLMEDFYLLDIGCGSGRLAKPLSQFLKGKYLGIDIVPELVNYARQIVEREDWRFEVASGLSIPEKDAKADMICFFSVFTHLLHEQSYLYLQEAKRVLKPGGKIVFSFLDFVNPEHWQVFEGNLLDLELNAHPLNMFMSQDAIRVWADRLGLKVLVIEDANKIHVPLSKPIRYESGTVSEKSGTFWQSLCVLQKMT